jgi:hypothetical protein
MKKFKRIIYVLFFCFLLFAIFQVSSSNVDSLRRFTPPLADGQESPKSDVIDAAFTCFLLLVIVVGIEIGWFFIFKMHKHTSIKVPLIFILPSQVGVSVLLFVAKAFVSFYLSIFLCVLFSIIMICIRIPVYLTFLKGDKDDRIGFLVTTGFSCAVPTVILGFTDVFWFWEILKLINS